MNQTQIALRTYAVIYLNKKSMDIKSFIIKSISKEGAYNQAEEEIYEWCKLNNFNYLEWSLVDTVICRN